jgi:hypothetical protein
MIGNTMAGSGVINSAVVPCSALQIDREQWALLSLIALKSTNMPTPEPLCVSKGARKRKEYLRRKKRKKKNEGFLSHEGVRQIREYGEALVFLSALVVH